MFPKPKSKRRVRLSCTTSTQIGEAVEQLLWSGLYGNNRAAVVERLISDAVMAHVKDGLLKITDGEVSRLI